MKKNKNLFFQPWKQGVGLLIAGFLAFGMIPSLSASAGSADRPFIEKAGSIPVTEGNVTYEQPFKKGTAGSPNFRIPILLTLENGDLFAAADARWETSSDGGGLDSIASISSDGGKTWNYSFPLFFPDSDGYAGRNATTIIDPGVVEGPDGTIYFIADVNPTGSTTLFKTMGTGTGYVTVDGKRYLALTKEYGNVDTEPTDDNLTTYPYYVDDFDENGYAKILKREDGSETGYGVDEWYNLYTVENGKYVDNLRQAQVNKADTQIQQNCYYRDSLFHVYSIDYIWVITSRDHGRTWEHPRNINDQVKRHENENGILISPGQGISTKCGDIVIGFYNTQDGEENASFGYSTDNGETWKRTEDVPGAAAGGRWSSENEIVELEDGTLRMFYRTDSNRICYADAVKDETGEYHITNNVISDFVAESSWNGCNVTAISYSQKINGKQVILFAGTNAKGRRANGTIYAFLVNEDENHTMELFSTFAVPNSLEAYSYSCITEMQGGNIGLLWEYVNTEIIFDTFSILEIMPDANLPGAILNVDLGKGESYTRTYGGEGKITQEPDAAIATATATDGGVTITGVGSGTTSAVVDGVKYRITVTVPVLNAGAEKVFKIASLTTESSDSNVLRAEEYEAPLIGIHDHTLSLASSLNSFSLTADENAAISDAEFTFNGSGTTWQIKNEKTNKYLTNAEYVDTYFSEAAADMTVTPNSDLGTFRICKADGTRYIFFFFNEMNFNSNRGYSVVNTGSYEMTLLEKQDSESDEDVIPGYKKATSITDGKRYLISYIWEDGSVIILYPTNGKNNQTKLAYRLVNNVRLTGLTAGTASVGIDGKTYHYTIADENCEHPHTSLKYAIAADCVYDGYTGDVVCDACGKVLEGGTSIPSVGHDWDDGVVTKKVTATEDGEKVYTCKHDPFHTRTETIYSSAYAAFLSEYEEVVRLVEDAGLYTPESAKELEKVFEEGTQIEESRGASRSEMYRSTAVMQQTKASLIKKTAETMQEELSAALGKTDTDISLKGGVSDAVWKTYTDACKAAAEVSSSASADEVWALLKALQAAQKNLDEAKAEAARTAAAAALANAVKAADGLYNAGQGSYTAASWQAFVTAYKAAKNPAANADPAALQKLAKELQTAQSKLVRKAANDSKPPVPVIEQGKIYDAGYYYYKVTSISGMTVEVTGLKNKALKKLTINNTVKLGGKDYKVTSVAANAFKGNKKVTGITIKKGVTKIGSNAFAGCTKVKKAVIKSTALKTIGAKAFSGCKNLKSITIKSKALKKVGKNAFKGIHKKATIKVPKASLKKYKKLLKKGQAKTVKIK